jgi:nitroreductase/NAD-dependent dihydropyrimidine dehydrogenase PreA subunit
MPHPEVTIDITKCTGCQTCISVCPDQTIAIIDKVAAIVGEKCMICGHCMAACPTDAITVQGIDVDAGSFTTFESDERWLSPGDFDISQLVRLMRSRRSIRNYSDKSVPVELLNDLVKIGATAPSGTNSQKWTFTILQKRADVLHLGDKVAEFFTRLNRQANSILLRKSLQLLGKPELQNYYNRYHKTVSGALEDWQERNIDRLFHGAPAAILVGSQPGASCPAEDALLATQNILLAAHGMGLGTCLIGYVVEAIKRDKSIKKYLNIPPEENIYSVIAIGHGIERYQTLTGRKKIFARVFAG